MLPLAMPWTPVADGPIGGAFPVVLTFAAVGYVAAATAVSLWNAAGGARLPGGRGPVPLLLTPIETLGAVVGGALGLYTGGLAGGGEVAVVGGVSWTIPTFPVRFVLHQRGTTAGLVSLAPELLVVLPTAAGLLAGMALALSVVDGWPLEPRPFGPIAGVLGVGIAAVVGFVSGPVLVAAAVLLWLNLRLEVGSVRPGSVPA